MLGHKKGRLVLSVAGVCFAVIVMFMEVGFLSGFKDAQVSLLRRLRGDLVIINRKRETLSAPGQVITLARLNQVRQFPEVREVVPLYEARVRMKNPDSDNFRTVDLLAFPPESDPVDLPGLRGLPTALRRSDSFLWDERSRPLFGDVRPGRTVEVAGRRLHHAGTFQLGANFTRDGIVVVGSQAWFALGGDPQSVATGLIRAQPGADLPRLEAQLRAFLPPDLEVVDLRGAAAREDAYIGRETPVGVIFGSGLVIGFVIGVVICYQTLYNEVLDHLPQYATIRAMGFPDNYLRGVVLGEAVCLGVLGFVPGVALSFLLYATLTAGAGFEMVLTPARILTVFLLTIPMCCAAGMLALRRALTADPAEVF